MSHETKQGSYTPTTPRTDIIGLPLMIDAKTCAELGDCSTRHILNLLNTKQLKGVKIGNTWRVGRDYFLHDVLGLEVES